MNFFRTSAGKTPDPGAKPIRLVYIDDRGKFAIDPGAIEALQQIQCPVGVIAVCGRARQGKSFILNQLLGRSSGFQVAPTHKPCTKGLWIWSSPMERTLPDGTKYALLLLDSEGIDAYDQTGTYSTQIFSLAVLLSSMFIYNQMGGIDEVAIDRLSLVTEMTKHIRVRSSAAASVEELSQFSPAFVWLLRDFYLDLSEDGRQVTPKEYLELALRPSQGGARDVAAKNQIRTSIRTLFPERECFTLVRPLNNEQELQQLDKIPLDRMRKEFQQGMTDFTQHVFRRTKPKQMGMSVLNGPMLAGMTQSFVQALNQGAVPTIATSLQSVEESECRKALDTALDRFRAALEEAGAPCDEAQLAQLWNRLLESALTNFSARAVGSSDIRRSHEKKLRTTLEKEFQTYRQLVFVNANRQCERMVNEMRGRLTDSTRAPDVSYTAAAKVVDELAGDYASKALGPEKWERLSAFLRDSVKGVLADVYQRAESRHKAAAAEGEARARAAQQQAELTAAQLEPLRQRVAAAEGRAAEAQARLAATTSQVEAAETARGLRDAQLEAAKREMESVRTAALAERERNERRLEGLQETQRAALAEKEKELQRLRTELEGARNNDAGRIAALQAELSADRARLTTREAELRAANEELGRGRAELQAALEQSTRSQAAAAEARTRAAAAEQQLAEGRQIVEQMQQQHQAEVQQLKGHLEQERAERATAAQAFTNKREQWQAAQHALEERCTLYQREAEQSEAAVVGNKRMRREPMEGPPEAPADPEPMEVPPEAPDASNNEYKKWPMMKLKKELTERGFAHRFLEINQPKKQQLLGLYEECVLKIK